LCVQICTGLLLSEFLAQIKNISSFSLTPTAAVAKLSEHFRVTPILIRRRISDLSCEIEQHLGGVPLEKVVLLSDRKRKALGYRELNEQLLFQKKSVDIWAK